LGPWSAELGRRLPNKKQNGSFRTVTWYVGPPLHKREEPPERISLQTQGCQSCYIAFEQKATQPEHVVPKIRLNAIRPLTFSTCPANRHGDPFKSFFGLENGLLLCHNRFSVS